MISVDVLVINAELYRKVGVYLFIVKPYLQFLKELPPTANLLIFKDVRREHTGTNVHGHYHTRIQTYTDINIHGYKRIRTLTYMCIIVQ